MALDIPAGSRMRELVILEQLVGSLSLVCVCLVFIAYGSVSSLRTAPNTFIIFASIVNVGASVGFIIGDTGLITSTENPSPLCQTQAFLLQMCVQSDLWWAFGLAINVFLVFFRGADPRAWRQRLWTSASICYGGPLVLAVICLKVPAYGDAGAYCWIDQQWSILRIVFDLLPVWLCILGTLMTYASVAYRVFHSRNRMDRLANRVPSDARTSSGIKNTVRPRVQSLPHGNFYGTAVIKIHGNQGFNSCPTVNDAGPATLLKSVGKRDQHHRYSLPVNSTSASTIITSTNSLAQDQIVDESMLQRVKSAIRGILGRFTIGDPVKRACVVTPLLFGISVVLTWTPPSILSIVSLASNPAPYAYYVATACLLPLQGVRNAVLFLVTNHSTLKMCIGTFLQRCRDRLGSWRPRSTTQIATV